jgi:hypothetical protein
VCGVRGLREGDLGRHWLVLVGAGAASLLFHGPTSPVTLMDESSHASLDELRAALGPLLSAATPRAPGMGVGLLTAAEAALARLGAVELREELFRAAALSTAPLDEVVRAFRIYGAAGGTMSSFEEALRRTGVPPYRPPLPALPPPPVPIPGSAAGALRAAMANIFPRRRVVTIYPRPLYRSGNLIYMPNWRGKRSKHRRQRKDGRRG